MKTSLTIQEFAQQVAERAAKKHDLVADTRIIGITTNDDNEAILEVGDRNPQRFTITPHAHTQIASRVDIPQRYYDRMLKEAPHLLGQNVRQWFDKYPCPRMIRTLDGTARAFLSDSYARMDDDAFTEVVVPAIADIPGYEIVSCAIEPTKTFIKMKSAKFEREVKVGDAVQFGLAFSNSEVGAGRLTGSLFAYQLICSNGMVMEDEMFAQTHLGRRQGRRDFHEVFKLDTVNMDAKATILKLRDFATTILSDKFIDAQVDKMRSLTGVKIEEPVKAVEVLAKRHAFSEGTKNSILSHLIEGGDLSLWGLQNAVTRASADEQDYTEAHRMEAIGGQMLTLAPSDYRELKLAA